ncbi:MAG TPA: DnaA regulatory inactivator Hda, partial [Rubrivivax sp.]|nr:DnaA regulatory inactivator Hda [Rubrivivax sp.]
MKQIPLTIVPDPLPTFDTYLPGVNLAAVEHLRASGPGAPPVYLWGPPGSGKTHLLRATLHQHQQRGAAVGSFDAADPAPWLLQPGWTLVAVDRCDELDAQRQQAAFALFVHALQCGVLWLAAGRVPPVDLGLRGDLRTRLAWGHVFALQPAAEHEVRAALRREADRRGIFLADEVIDYLLRRSARDLGSLMRLLERIDHFALARQRTVTLPLLRQVLQEGAAETVAAAAVATGAPS